MTRKMTFLLVCSTLFSTAYATTIYRWTDENGRTQISDNLPGRYRDVATKIDTSAADISEAQRREALKLADQERQRAKASVDEAKVAKRQSASVQAGELKPPRSKKETECEVLIRTYRESQECFQPFKLREADGSFRQDGAVREEAFQYCTSIPAPFDKCALPAQ